MVIILVAHPRKSKDDFSNDDVAGSADITNKADVVMSYQRSDSTDCNSILQVTKNRLFGKYAVKDDAVRLMYSEKSKRIFSSDGDRHYGWEKNFTKTDEDAWMI